MEKRGRVVKSRRVTRRALEIKSVLAGLERGIGSKSPEVGVVPRVGRKRAVRHWRQMRSLRLIGMEA